MRQRGFTLVEQLALLVIIGILASLVLPKVGRGKLRSLHTACVHNVHNLGTALETYSNDSGGLYPPTLAVLLGGGTPVLKALPRCPSDDSSYEPGYEVNNVSRRFTVSCQGIHHKQLGNVQQGYPQFESSGSLNLEGPPDE